MGLEDMQAVMATEFSMVIVGDQAVINIGQAIPPVLVGDTPDEVNTAAANVAYVAVQPIARITVSEAALRSLIEALPVTLGNLLRSKAETS